MLSRKAVIIMADKPRDDDKLEKRVTSLEQQVSNVVTKLDMFIEESRAARARQDADMREIRQDMKDMKANFDSKIDGMAKHVRNMSIVTIIGVATMVVAVLLK